MIWILVPIITIFVILLLLLLSRIYIYFYFSYKEQQPILTVRVTLFRLLSFKKEINLSDQAGVFTKETELNQVLDQGKHWLDLLKQMNRSVSILCENILIHQLDWRTVAGTGEAVSTGMAGAAFWSVKGGLTGYIVEKSILRCRPLIHFEPKFNEKCFTTKMESMVSIRMGKAIRAFIKITRLNKTSTVDMSGGDL